MNALRLAMAKKPTGTIDEQPMTKRQVGKRGVSGYAGNGGNSPPPPATFETYRQMRAHPTIALARAAATAPVKAAGYSWVADDNAPADARDVIAKAIDPLWRHMVTTALFALDYGFQTAELVWASVGGVWQVKRFKALLPELTTILVDETGDYAGLQQGDIRLPTDRAFLITYDREGDNYYGRARHENIRANAWHAYLETAKAAAKYFGKAAGVIPMIRYPVGQSENEAGQTVDNFDIASAVLSQLGQGHGVTMPWEIQGWAEAAIARGADPLGLMAWQIEFLETKAGHGQEMIDDLRYKDSLCMRGWLVPERTALEGQHGTLAEANKHADIALSTAQEVLDLIVEAINTQVVAPTMAVNYGPEYATAVRAEAAPLVNEDRDFFRQLVQGILTEPGNADVALGVVDLDSLLDQAGVPKYQDTIDQEAIIQDAKAREALAGNPSGNAPPVPKPSMPLAAALMAQAGRYARRGNGLGLPR